ncbi:uncharacterized protein LOC124326925 [Daphnia pulicaria]|uniref:uncharacterized protein LOC124326925 n=1 Tax=Daphnia pulicaria TaxID=35523 RepID=UPI001EEAAFCA|nr:uncharacterized protein LOC124326925 [Daphnia pulicaria]
MANSIQVNKHQQNFSEVHLNLAQPLPLTKYNLMEDTYGDNWAKTPADKYLDLSFCTIEYANEKKLQQDHPCLIQLIRDKYLLQPASKELPYVLDHPETIDPSNGQANDIREILKNKV